MKRFVLLITLFAILISTTSCAFQPKIGDIMNSFFDEPTRQDKVLETLKYIRSKGIKAAISVKPNTPIEEAFPYLSELDMVLIMTVEPGFGGQKLIPETLKKIKALKKYCIENNINIDIEVDGGIGPDNIGLLTSNGANVIVAGSAVFKADDYNKVISKMLDEANKNPYIG